MDQSAKIEQVSTADGLQAKDLESPEVEQSLLQRNTRLQSIQGEQYRIVTVMETAGMGEIYLAIEESSGKEVVVKVPDIHQGDEFLVAWFSHREQRFPKDFRHPNVVATLGHGNLNGLPFVIMEYVDGLDLASWLTSLAHEGKKPTWREVCVIVRQAAIGLSEAHARSIYHRDIKPTNLILDEQQHVKILDWGLVRYALRLAQTLPTDSQRVLGTVEYLSWEQAADPSKADARSDLYSLGCTMYQLLTGKVPFDSHRTPAGQLHAHKTAVRPSVRTHRRDVPWRVVRLIRRAMAIEPKERFQTARQFIRALDRTTARGIGGLARRLSYDTGQLALRQSKKLGKELRTPAVIFLLVAMVGWPLGWFDPPLPPEHAISVNGNDISIPAGTRQMFPELVDLILTSTDLDEDERQRWMNRMPKLKDEERNNLYRRLMTFKLANTQSSTTVPQDLRERYPRLFELIMVAKSMRDLQERNHWLSMLYVMDDEERNRLQEILEN